MNYRGIGASGGEAPLTVAAMAADMVAAIRALGLEQVDLIGFSLGGFVAQQILLNAPCREPLRPLSPLRNGFCLPKTGRSFRSLRHRR